MARLLIFLTVLVGLVTLATSEKVKHKRIVLKREDGLDILKDNNRRQLHTDRTLQLSLELELEHDKVGVLKCPELKYRPEYCPIAEDVSVLVDGVLTKSGNVCETYMTDDFKCVLTISNQGAVEGLVLQNKHAIDFIVPEGCPECADVELDPTMPDCGTGSPGDSGRRLRGEKTNNENINIESQHSHDVTKPEERDLLAYYEWLNRWEGCYPNMDTPTDIYMGIGVGSNLVARAGGEENVYSFIEMIVAETNAIYLAQLNVKLHVKTIVVSKTAGAYVWDNPTCSDDIYQQLDKFKLWNKPSTQGLWHIIDDCYVSTKPIGLAVVGSVCGQGNNIGITHHGRHLGKTWLTFAHEIGHNIGAQHTFQEGQGTTGGIMDYGDGLLNNEYQFNSKYSKDSICNVLTNMVTNSNCDGKVNRNTPLTAQCGNGVVDSSEQCECPDGALECNCCSNCQLKPNAQCSPFGNSCCTDQCQYAGTAQTCENSDGTGYCRGGVCASADCASLGLGPFCGTRASNPCRKKCSYGPYCIELSSNDAIRDGALCRTGSIPEGVCTAGECIPVSGSNPTNFPTPNPTTKPPTNFPTPNPTTKPPTNFPTPNPTTKPPTNFPTPNPTTKPPTNFPTPSPTTKPPTSFPTPNPTPDTGGSTCGDGICSSPENCHTCPEDCPMAGWRRGGASLWCCGDGIYHKKERYECPGNY